jgi:hypothetical protein
MVAVVSEANDDRGATIGVREHPRLRAVATTLSAVALTALVAVAARHHDWTGGGSWGKRAALWIGAGLGILAATGGLALAVLSRRDLRSDLRRAVLPLTVAALAVVVAVAGVRLFYTLGRSGGVAPLDNTTPVRILPGGGSPAGIHLGRESHRHIPWIVAGSGTAVVLLAAAIAVVVVRRRRRLPEPSPTAPAEVVQVLDETLDDLRAEGDPRRAVIAAYARMERTLARHDLARQPFEAPFEYLARVLSALQASRSSARRLTDLFERAKFGHHAVAESMKEDAIDALLVLRGELEAH